MAADDQPQRLGYFPWKIYNISQNNPYIRFLNYTFISIVFYNVQLKLVVA